MQLNSKESMKAITYVVGDEVCLKEMVHQPSFQPFAEETIAFLNCVSKKIMQNREAKEYPDVITFGFWCRKAHMEQEKKRFQKTEGLWLGRGVVFHVAPSNVAVNYAYSFVTGLITGNANIVRLPSKDFPQVNLINNGIKEALKEYPQFAPYICFVKYGHEKEINDTLSELCDVRVIWGGDATIRELRKSQLEPRTTEITFADRYSFSIIQADAYLEIANKQKVALDFYNDTYLTDQNACTSPRLVVWTGNQVAKAMETFWKELHQLVLEKYQLQTVQAVNKLIALYKTGASLSGVTLSEPEDNLLYRVRIKEITAELLNYKENSGYFFEYVTEDLMDLAPLCSERCQTVSFIGDIKIGIKNLINSGVRGIDRVVPIGNTMDFDFIWDGYDLVERMTRNISNIIERGANIV